MDLRPSSRYRSGPPPTRTATVLTADGERISVAYDAPLTPAALTFVVAHGFTGELAPRRQPTDRHGPGRARRCRLLRHRGHGSSSGVTTLGDDEVFDLDAAVGWARWLGAEDVVTVGFSMGGSVVLRQAALAGRSQRETADAVVSVSAAGFWFYKGTPPMRLLHQAVGSGRGRADSRPRLRHPGHRPGVGGALSRSPRRSPRGSSPPVPLLVVHGDQDAYFPVEHARSIVEAARAGAAERGVADRCDEWIETGFGHAESATSIALADRIGEWGRRAVRAESGDRA